MPKPILRPYQMDAVYDTLEALSRFQKVLFSLPTGAGKSLCLATLAAEWPNICGQYGLPDRVLWVAQRDELIWQGAEHLLAVTGEEPAIEKGQQTIKDNAMFYNRRCLVSSIQTMLSEKRRAIFPENSFGLVLCDEAHHAVCEGHQTVLNAFPMAKLIGCTATCDRADQISLGKAFDFVSYHYELLDAIKDGWLCKIKQEFIESVELDFSGCGVTATGDLSPSDQDKIINQERPLHEIAKATIDLSGDRQTIIFMPSVASANGIAAMLNRYGHDCKSVDGTTDEDERRRIIQDYKDGRFRLLANCDLLNEGMDAPATSCIVLASQTKSRARYSQRIGRGLRGGVNCPIPGKTDCLVIDLVGSSCKHKLVHCADLLGGAYDEEVIQYIEDKCRGFSNGRGDGGTDVMSVLLEAACKAEELRAEKRAQILAEAKLRRKTIDPFTILSDAIGLRESAVNDPEWWANTPASVDQVVRLEKAGIKAEGDLSFGEARRLIAEVNRRRKDGVCSFKQARLLRARGLDPSMSLEQAGAIMTHYATRPEGFKFAKEDGVHKALAKRRGHPLRYNDLKNMPGIYIPPGSPMQVRQGGVGDAIPYESKKPIYAQSVQLFDGGNRIRLYNQGHQIEMANAGIYDLKRGLWIGGKPKPSEKPAEAQHHDEF